MKGRAYAFYLLFSTGTYWESLPAGSAHAQNACAEAVCVASLEALTGPAAHHSLRRLTLQCGLHDYSLTLSSLARLGTLRFDDHNCEETKDLARKAVEMKWRWRGLFWIADYPLERSRVPNMRSSLSSSFVLDSPRNIPHLKVVRVKGRNRSARLVSFAPGCAALYRKKLVGIGSSVIWQGCGMSTVRAQKCLHTRYDVNVTASEWPWW